MYIVYIVLLSRVRQADCSPIGRFRHQQQRLMAQGSPEAGGRFESTGTDRNGIRANSPWFNDEKDEFEQHDRSFTDCRSYLGIEFRNRVL